MVHVSSLIFTIAALSTTTVLAAPRHGLQQRESQELEARARTKAKAGRPRPKPNQARPQQGTDWVKVVNGVVEGVRESGIIPPSNPAQVPPTDPSAPVVRSLERELLEEREFEELEARTRTRKSPPRRKNQNRKQNKQPNQRTDWVKVVNGVVDGVRESGIIPPANSDVVPPTDPNAPVVRSLELELLEERELEELEARTRTRKSPPRRKNQNRKQNRQPTQRTDWAKVVNGVVDGVRESGIIPPANPEVVPPTDPGAPVVRSLEELEARTRTRKSPPRRKNRKQNKPQTHRTDWAKVVNGVVDGVRESGIIPPANPELVPPTDPSIAVRELFDVELD